MKTEVLEAIKARRSVRSYKKEQIRDEELNAVLEAGTYAATGMGRQSPRMVVVQDAETIAQLSGMNAAVMGSDGDPFYGAPTVVVVFADGNIGTWLQDGSLVMGNLMLAAYAAGLGSCWINRATEAFDTPEGKALMKKWGIPENYRGVANCILGYPDGPLPEAKPRKADYITRA
ncbi:MAG: nitroreductase [Eubacteriales bacterium]|nr:nitroreductase [Eubacteriales bacterium]